MTQAYEVQLFVRHRPTRSLELHIYLATGVNTEEALNHALTAFADEYKVGVFDLMDSKVRTAEHIKAVKRGESGVSLHAYKRLKDAKGRDIHDVLRDRTAETDKQALATWQKELTNGQPNEKMAADLKRLINHGTEKATPGEKCEDSQCTRYRDMNGGCPVCGEPCL